jgi:hypothetical protein
MGSTAPERLTVDLRGRRRLGVGGRGGDAGAGVAVGVSRDSDRRRGGPDRDRDRFRLASRFRRGSVKYANHLVPRDIETGFVDQTLNELSIYTWLILPHIDLRFDWSCMHAGFESKIVNRFTIILNSFYWLGRDPK